MSTSDNKSRLYISISKEAVAQPAATKLALDRLAAQLDIACVDLPLGHEHSADDPQKEEAIRQIIRALQQQNIAVLAHLTSPLYLENRKSFEKALEKAKNMNCDGVHLVADPALFERARKVLGGNAIIGCECGASRHLAMQLGEKGADYVAFHPADAPPPGQKNETELEELVGWWQQLFEVPCVAQKVIERSQIERLLQIPADFIALGPDLWPELSRDDELLSWLSAKCPAPAKGGE